MNSVSEAVNEHSCSICHTSYHESDLITFGESKICAKCKPAFFQQLKEGATLPIEMSYATLGRRLGARIIDGILLYAINIVMFMSFGMSAFNSRKPVETLGLFGVLTGLQYIIAISYETFFIGKFGATLGKMACGVIVVSGDGGKVSYLKAFGRFFGNLLSGLILGIGYLMAAFDSEKRALHDRICNTRVILKKKK